MGASVVIGTLALLLGGAFIAAAAAGDGKPRLPPATEVAIAMCKLFQAQGLPTPQPPAVYLDQDLAIRTMKALQLPGSWPPPGGSHTLIKQFWASVMTLAARVRAGEVSCEFEPPGPTPPGPTPPGPMPPGPTPPGPGPTPPPPEPTPEPVESLPDFEAVKLYICERLLPLSNPETAYLDAGIFPADGAASLAAEALIFLGYVGALPPPAATSSVARQELWAASRAHALAVIEGQTSCEVANKFITIDVPRGPGGYVQIEAQDPDDSDKEFSALAHLVDLYPGMVGAPPSVRLQKAREIVNHPLNVGLLIPATDPYIQENIGPMTISFFAKWKYQPQTILARFEPGASFAVPYLPRDSL